MTGDAPPLNIAQHFTIPIQLIEERQFTTTNLLTTKEDCRLTEDGV